MVGIILKCRKLAEGSLLLHLIMQNGELKKLRLPKILKSKKRNNPFCYPGVIWDIVLQGNPKEYMVPKEMNLLFSPIPLDISYKELELFAEVFKITDFLLPGDNHEKSYLLLYEFLNEWPKRTDQMREHLMDLFYLKFLKILGYFSIEGGCKMCGNKIEEAYFYEFNQGEICENCYTQDRVLNGIQIFFTPIFLNQEFSKINSQDFTGKTSSHIRDEVIRYLKEL